MKDKISSRQYMAIIIMFGLGSFIVSHGSRSAGQDTWFVIILGLIIAIPQLLMIAYINTKNEGKNIFIVFKEYYGKVFGTIFSLYFIISLIILFIFLTRLFSEYIKLTSLHQTPILLISILLTICITYCANKSIQSIARLVGLLFLIFIFSFFFLSLFSISLLKNIENIFPMFHLTKIQTLKSSYESYMNPFYEFFILLIFGSFLFKGKSQYKTIFISVITLTLIISLNSFKNLLILGLPAYKDLYFPSFVSNTVISSGTVLERFELLFSFIYTICMFAKLILFLKATKIGIDNTFKDKSKIIYILLIPLMVILSTYLFNDLSHLMIILYSPFRTYMNIGLLLIIITTFFMTVYKNKHNEIQHI